MDGVEREKDGDVVVGAKRDFEGVRRWSGREEGSRKVDGKSASRGSAGMGESSKVVRPVEVNVYLAFIGHIYVSCSLSLSSNSLSNADSNASLLSSSSNTFPGQNVCAASLRRNRCSSGM